MRRRPGPRICRCCSTPPARDAAAALRHIARERITSLYLVPTLYHDLVGHPDFAACDTSSVTKLGFAGAAMPDGLLKRVDAAFRPALFLPRSAGPVHA